MVLVDALAACFLAGVAVVLALQFFRVAAVQTRCMNQRITAGAEAANIIDRVVMVSWDKLPNGKLENKLDGIELSKEAGKVLPQAVVAVEISPAEGTPEAKRIRVQVQWQMDVGESMGEVHLVAWKYRGK